MSVDWTDDGIIIAASPYGDSNLIVQSFTQDHGRHAGLVSGGQSRRRRADWLQGNIMSLRWQARNEEQLGSLTGETTAQIPALLFDTPDRLDAMQSACALLYRATPERVAYPHLFQAAIAMLKDLLRTRNWAQSYIHFEVEMLASLGYGLDFSQCALTGQTDGLTHVSPRTGRAVRGDAAPDYVARLLSLPGFLLDRSQPASHRDIAAGMKLTGHFLDQRLFAALERPVPLIRERLMDHFADRTDVDDE